MLGYKFHHFEYVTETDLRSSSYTPEVLLLDHKGCKPKTKLTFYER